MCNNCNCVNYNQCSIVGFMPIGFCCSICQLYNKNHTCLKTKTNRKSAIGKDDKEKLEEIRPISTSIEDGILKVVIGKKDKKKSIYIDLQKQFESR